jgi:ATP-dependent RNA helicase DDX24/MAK5
MCAPDERRVLRGLLSSLKRGINPLYPHIWHADLHDLDESEIPEIAVELHMLDRLKERVQLARKIETAQHKVQKENHDRKWLREAAEAMEVELDSDLDRYEAISNAKIFPLNTFE